MIIGCSRPGGLLLSTPLAVVVLGLLVLEDFTVAVALGFEVVTFADDLVVLEEPELGIAVNILIAPTVGELVHCHFPSTNAQDAPSGASSYGSVSLITFPAGSSNLALPALFERVRPVAPLVITR